MARIARKAGRVFRQSAISRQIARGNTGSTGSAGPSGGAGGAKSDAMKPETATRSTKAETTVTPKSVRISSLPAIEPKMIARKVKACTSPLPPTISEGCSHCGSTEYLIGANMADCAPIRNSTK
jgi:hypothetical protein